VDSTASFDLGAAIVSRKFVETRVHHDGRAIGVGVVCEPTRAQRDEAIRAMRR
jgi:hypothetical protein